LIIVQLEGSFPILERFLVMCAKMGFFLALANVPVTETKALFFVASLFITALRMPMLGERAGPLRWAAVLIGFLGVFIMVCPSSMIIQMMSRQLGGRDKALTLAFYMPT
jgi:S-adenosylmethionine uptake transporter